MITFKDALTLTKTKLKTRKFRNVFAMFTLSLGTIIILSFLISVNGVLDFGKNIFKDSLADRAFAQENFYGDIFATSIGATPLEVDPSKPYEPVQVNPQEKLEQRKSEGAKSVFTKKSQSSISFSLKDTTHPEVTTYTIAVDPLFVTDFLDSNYSFEDRYEGKIPVIVSTDFLKTVEQGFVYFNETAKERYEETRTVYDKYIGKTFRLQEQHITDGEQYSDTGIDIIIAGISSSTGLGGSYIDSYAMNIPLWAIEKNETLKEIYTTAETTVIYEFETKQQRDAAVETFQKNLRESSADSTSFLMPLFGPYESFTEAVAFFRKIVFGLGGFVLAISCFILMSTLGKIIGDSRQEIGVFRAVGGQKADVRKIFFTYAWVLVTGGFIFGLLLSSILTVTASLLWGENMFYTLIEFGSVLDVKQPALMFVSFPLLYILAFYGVLFLLGMLASLIPVYRASKIDPIKVLRDK